MSRYSLTPWLLLSLGALVPAARAWQSQSSPSFNAATPLLLTDYDRGVAAFRAGNYARAADLFAKAEPEAPGATDALLYEAKALIHITDFAGAEQALRAYIGLHGNSDDALYLLGFVLHRQDRPRESLEVYTRAAALKPPMGDDLKVVGLDYVLLHDYSDAVKWLEKAVEFDPKNTDGWYCLGRAYYSEGRLPDAEKAFLAVLGLDARNARAENNLGLVLESEGKFDDAMAAYRKAIGWQAAGAQFGEQPLVNLGTLLLEQQRTAEAVPPLEKAVALAPGNAVCRLKLGTAYLRQRRLTDAERELKKSVELDPENPSPHYQLGRLYQEMHRLDQARAEFKTTQDLQSHALSVTAPPSGP